MSVAAPDEPREHFQHGLFGLGGVINAHEGELEGAVSGFSASGEGAVKALHSVCLDLQGFVLDAFAVKAVIVEDIHEVEGVRAGVDGVEVVGQRNAVCLGVPFLGFCGDCASGAGLAQIGGMGTAFALDVSWQPSQENKMPFSAIGVGPQPLESLILSQQGFHIGIEGLVLHVASGFRRGDMPVGLENQVSFLVAEPGLSARRHEEHGGKYGGCDE